MGFYPDPLSRTLTTHVVPVRFQHEIESGFFCRHCKRQFQIHLWPHDEMLVACECPCICHRNESPTPPTESPVMVGNAVGRGGDRAGCPEHDSVSYASARTGIAVNNAPASGTRQVGNR